MKAAIFTRKTAITFMLLFIGVSLMTIKLESPFDGNNLIGFPFRFYEYLGGKRSPEPVNRNIFNYLNLTIDLVILGITSILIEYLKKKVKKYQNK